MLIEQTLTLLHALKLPGMAAALEAQRGVPDLAALSFEERLALLLERERAAREDRRLTRLLQLARLRVHACVEDINVRAARGLDRGLVLRLAGGDWITRHEVVLITGATGTGKTWLACALGHQACRQGHTVRYLRLPRLLGEELVRARGDGSYGKLLQQLARTDLLILDDWGLAPLGNRERRDLLELIEDRGGRRATLVTSQLPVEHWHARVRAGRQRHVWRRHPRPARAPRAPDPPHRRLAPAAPGRRARHGIGSGRSRLTLHAPYHPPRDTRRLRPDRGDRLRAKRLIGLARTA